MINILYFARLRESLGIADEVIDIHDELTVADLMNKLAQRGGAWQQAFDGCLPLRAAVNQTLVSESALIKNGDEVAFFPPVTGG
jgi:sulfur-carrier protein